MKRMREIRKWCGLGLALALLNCSSEDKPPPLERWAWRPLVTSADGRLTGTPCPLTLLSANVDCGELTVPESRTGGSTRMLRLPVIVIRSSSPLARTREPVVYLEGGPGGNAIQSVTSGFTIAFEPLVTERDLVVFDQRGTGYGLALTCPELGGPGTNESLMGAAAATQALTQLQSCRTRLSSIAHLDDYDSRENAADVDDLRSALGYAKWHLLGVSYGTRLALDVARYHAEGVSSVILDSVLPTQVDFAATGAVNFKRALDAMFQTCAAQSDCALGYPNLERVFYDLIDRLNAQPAPVGNRAGMSHQLTGSDVMSLIFNLSYSASAVAAVPEIISQLSEGDFSLFEGVVFGDPDPTAESTLSLGMYLSVVCSDYAPFASLEATLQAEKDLPPSVIAISGVTRILTQCKTWNVSPAAPEEHLAAASDVPTLLLSGFHDPVTPPEWASLAATTLTHSQLLNFKNVAHGIISEACAGPLMNTYWNDPSGDPSGQCRNRDISLQFSVPQRRLALTRLPPGITRAQSTAPEKSQQDLIDVVNEALARRKLFP